MLRCIIFTKHLKRNFVKTFKPTALAAALLQAKIQTLFFLCLASAAYLFGQGTAAPQDLYKIKLKNSELTALNSQDQIVFKRAFSNPHGEAVDLDNDGVDEYFLIDFDSLQGRPYYKIFIFSTVDSFYIADSIVSGFIEPYIIYSDELKGKIIVTGKERFDKFAADSDEIFLPIDCWKYENGSVNSVNDELYDIFIAANDSLIEFLDSYYENEMLDCSASVKVKAAVAAAYENYITAGEKSLAEQFIKKYYRCSDLEKFKEEINSSF